MEYSSLDVFCHCIDNFGDAGVAYRFAKEFKAAAPSCRVRLFIDNLHTLHAIENAIDPAKDIQEYGSVVYIRMRNDFDPEATGLGVADIMVEAFACDIPEKAFLMALEHSKLIINIEYLSAETWVEEYHLFESLLGRGTARKFFFLPGFRETTGGLVINSKLRAAMDGGGLDRGAALKAAIGGSRVKIRPNDGTLVGTVFTYARGFDTLIADLVEFGRDTLLIVFGEPSQRGMAAAFGRLSGVNNGAAGGSYRLFAHKNVRAVFAPFIPQHAYDTLLCCADFNLVRGEDSLARAVLSGKPFIWHAYVQTDKLQCVKAAALLETMRPYYEENGAGGVFADYGALTMAYNEADGKSTEQVTVERYGAFFKDLKKHLPAARAMYYFMCRACDMIAKFRDFLARYPESIPPAARRANMRDPLHLREMTTIINKRERKGG